MARARPVIDETRQRVRELHGQGLSRTRSRGARLLGRDDHENRERSGAVPRAVRNKTRGRCPSSRCRGCTSPTDGDDTAPDAGGAELAALRLHDGRQPVRIGVGEGACAVAVHGPLLPAADPRRVGVRGERAIYSMWDPAKHVRPYDRGPQILRLLAVGVDFGRNNPSTGLELGLSRESATTLVRYAPGWWTSGGTTPARTRPRSCPRRSRRACSARGSAALACRTRRHSAPST